MTNLSFLPILLLALLLTGQVPAWGAEQSVVLSDDVQMSLGNAFMAEGDYYRAITEYKKLAFLFPDSQHRLEALYQIGIAYYEGKDYEAAAKSFVTVRQTYAASHFSSAAFHEGLCYEKLGRPDDAARAFERSRLFDPGHPDAANAHLGLALNAVKRNNIPAGRAELRSFEVNFPDDARIPGLQKSYDLLDTYQAQPHKSPALAGTLSAIIPGSGQIYAKHYRDGLMAFLVNGLFIAGTIAAVNDEHYALAGIVGGVGLPFYVGNIYGAANAARKWNLSLSRKVHDDLAMTLDYHF